MRRAMRWLSQSAFALGIAAALGFGGYQAFATATLPYCEFDPPVLGPCGSQEECHQMCVDYYGSGWTGVCSQSCCVCLAA